jgi:uncharacterized protein YlaN (UPF0358 family)
MMNGKGWKSVALVLFAAFFIGACQTVPLHKIPAVAAYTNKHGITLIYPKTWHIEDATLTYKDLDAAATEGGAYMQIYSYDRTMAANPAAPVPASEAKIMIIMSRNIENLDYPQVLGELGNEVIDRAVFMINKKQAYKVHYRIVNQESGGKLDILSILLIDHGYIIRFICYPWNSRYEAQFEELAESFRSSGK